MELEDLILPLTILIIFMSLSIIYYYFENIRNWMRSVFFTEERRYLLATQDIDKEKKQSTGMAQHYQNLFEKAGWYAPGAGVKAMKYKITIAIAVFLVATPTAFGNPILQSKPAAFKIIFILLSTIIGFRLFDYYLDSHINRRYAEIKQNLAMSFDMFVIATKSGLSIEKTFENLAKEIGTFNQPLSQEYAITAIELNTLPNRRTVYKNLYKRVELPLVDKFVTTLIEAEAQGASISQSLSAQVEEFRNQSVMEAEIKAAKLPAILSIITVVFLMPAVFIIILAPTAQQLLETLPTSDQAVSQGLRSVTSGIKGGSSQNKLGF